MRDVSSTSKQQAQWRKAQFRGLLCKCVGPSNMCTADNFWGPSMPKMRLFPCPLPMWFQGWRRKKASCIHPFFPWAASGSFKRKQIYRGLGHPTCAQLQGTSMDLHQPSKWLTAPNVRPRVPALDPSVRQLIGRHDVLRQGARPMNGFRVVLGVLSGNQPVE